MVKCNFWELESTQKLLWFKFEKCLNAEKLLSWYFYSGWSTDPNDLNPTGLDSAFTDLSNKIGFIQNSALNRPGLIFEKGYRSVFELKRKRFNLNNWAAREKLLGRPAKRSAPAGCLSGCPHSSVRHGGAKLYGAMWVVRSDSNSTAGSHHRREATPARKKPSAASEGCWGLIGV